MNVIIHSACRAVLHTLCCTLLLRMFEIYIISLRIEVVQQLFVQVGSDYVCIGDADTMLLLTPKFMLAFLYLQDQLVSFSALTLLVWSYDQ